MAIKRIGFSYVSVSDISKAKAFFVDTLGLKVFEEHAGYGWLELKGPDGGHMGVGRANPQDKEMPAGSNAVIMFVTDTYEQTKQELTDKGVKLFNEIAGYPDVPRMILFKDPDGNLLQLVEETPGQTDKK